MNESDCVAITRIARGACGKYVTKHVLKSSGSLIWIELHSYQLSKINAIYCKVFVGAKCNQQMDNFYFIFYIVRCTSKCKSEE